jgi:glycerol-1-phosphate dehydrogenase [NAD(P)+]
MEGFMSERLPVFIGNQALAEFIRYCGQQGLRDFLLVADQNTYQALGKDAYEALAAQGFDVVAVVLKGEEVLANEHYLVRVLLSYDLKERTFLAAGSGTITDITRFVSHRVGRDFISLPTAPSVDGFTSIGAPLVVGGLKQTVVCQAPRAVFADLPTLAAAPRRLIAAGFGDLVGKYLSIADWKLGHLLWDEVIDEDIAGRMLGAAQDCAGRVRDIAGGSVEGVRLLMEGLIEAGFGMLEFGNTSPAGGAEHHIAHLWEMMMLADHRTAALHGAKVGVASVIAAGWHAELREMSRDQAAARLRNARLPDPQEEQTKIRSVFGPIADEILPTQTEFINMSGSRFEALKERILEQWEQVQAIADGVPAPDELSSWLRMVAGPVSPTDLKLKPEEVQVALDYSHYMRRRFTINKLRILLGLS